MGAILMQGGMQGFHISHYFARLLQVYYVLQGSQLLVIDAKVQHILTN